ncbi:hypothetical protein [Streptomyces sp. NPDC048637]|uniref:hypothetical protein n=1 Tax=Streptomyces sp. NPDC048637 TaxID=3155636 RepID=UPI00341D858D
MSEASTGRRILVLGAGEVGAAVSEALLRQLAPSYLAIHTSRQQTLHTRTRRLQSLAGASTHIGGSWGDIFSPCTLAQVPADVMTDRDRWQLAAFYHQPSKPVAQPDASMIYEVVREHRPDLIVDAVTSATSGPRTVLPTESLEELLRAAAPHATDNAHIAESVGKRALLDALLGNPTAPLSRYVANLDAALEAFDVQRYIKVSTSGLGGMGFACPYTHGTAADGFASDALLGKIGAAGVLHQLLWNLHHTRGRDVRLIVPLALVGWEEVRYGPYTHRGVGVSTRDDLRSGVQSLPPSPDAGVSPAAAQMVVVPAGDNSTYSRAEMALSTALGQFESVTREEVALAVAETALGSTKYDLLSAMDGAALHSSYRSAHMRDSLLRQMRDLEQEVGRPSVVSGNLGPGIAKDLFELHVLLEAAGSLHCARDGQSDTLAKQCADLMATDWYLRQQALSIGLGILTLDDQYLTSLPTDPTDKESSPSAGPSKAPQIPGSPTAWVDFRSDNVVRWQQALCGLTQSSHPMRHAFHIGDHDFEIGEVLAFHYFLTGRARDLNSA